MAKWTATDSKVTLVNVYGVTEAAVYQTHHTVPTLKPDCLSISDPRCVGLPYPDVTICVIPDADSDADTVEGSTEGEVYIGGPQVCRGYLNDEQLTRERFVTLSPHHACTAVCGTPGGTWPTRFFRTGDRARITLVGSAPKLQLLGRCDGQVKVMGRRVELGEIER